MNSRQWRSLPPGQLYAGGYGQTKQAGGKGKAVQGVAGWLSGALRGGAAKLNTSARTARTNAMNNATSTGELFDSASGVGKFRQGAAKGLSGVARGINKSPVAQKAINYGVPAAGALGTGAIGHGIGRSSGIEDGQSQGFDAGADYGIKATLANAPQDPGFLGRLMALFTGNAAGPDPAALKAMLTSQKGDILQRLRTS